jgi:hypothetical protein
VRRALFVGSFLGLGLAASLSACGRGCHGSVSREWDASYSVSFGGASGADASSATPPAPVATIVDAAPPEAGSSARDAAAAPPGLLGIFHREGPDERNLEIDPDGTFFWRIYGCDFGGGACGAWSVDGTSLVLTPTPPAKTIAWDDGVAFTRSVTKVILRQKGATIEARVFAADGEKLLQAWYAGRVCADCGKGQGPSGIAMCTKPLVRDCP